MKSNAQILIAEDHPDSAEVFTLLLQREGFFVTGIVRTAEEVIEKAGLSRPDLILMDIGLNSRCDGIEAARQIQSSYRIPVVFITGQLDDETRKRAVAMGPFGYLTKPVDPQALRATVELAI